MYTWFLCNGSVSNGLISIFSDARVLIRSVSRTLVRNHARDLFYSIYKGPMSFIGINISFLIPSIGTANG